VVFVIRKDIEADFRRIVGSRIEGQIETVYVMQELHQVPAGFAVPAERKKPWGTGHAVLAGRAAAAEPFAVINADDFYGRAAYAALAGWLDRTRNDPDAYAMVGYPLRNTLSDHGSVARGVCACDAAGNLATVVERTKIEKTGTGARFLGHDGVWTPLTGDEVVSMNFWGFKPSFLDRLEAGFARFLSESGADPKAEYFVPTVVNNLIERGSATVRVLRADSPWFGVTYPQDKPIVVSRIRDLVASGAYPDRLWG
jgi:hypothetical protein